jgi:hypothetical protein
LVNVVNVSLERIYEIDLNHYQITAKNIFL